MDKNKDKAMSMALRYLGYKMRTEKEIKEYLFRKKFSETDISYTLEKLKEYKYINDSEFTEFWIRDRYNFSNQGRYKIKNDLMKKGISREIIDEKVESFFDVEKERKKIEEIYFKKNSKNKKLTDKELISICNFILRKGFPGSLVRSVILRLHKESKSDHS